MAASAETMRLVNGVPLKKFPRLLKRIIERLGESSGSAFFDGAEEQQLTTMLSVSQRELRGICELCAYVFEQAAYSIQKPDVLEAKLSGEMGMAPDHAAAAKQVWASEAATYVAALRERHMVGPRVVKDSSWEMHLTMAESGGGAKRKDPTAIFELDLAPHDAPPDAHRGAPGSEVLNVECSHAELYDLFNTLQGIQSTIDQLAS